MEKPSARKGVRLETLEDECLLYDEDSVKIHILNRVAGSIWAMCDGQHTLQQMEARIRRQYEVPHDLALEEEIRQVLEEFGRLGLLDHTVE